MCEPATIATAALSIGGSIFSTVQQRQQAEAANKAAEIQHNIEVKRARQEAMDRQNQLSQDALEESQRINQQRADLALEALREQASIRVASAEGGVGGVSKIRSFLSADVQEDLARSDLDTNARNAQFNIAQANRGINNNRQARNENAFLTRQANTQEGPSFLEGAVDVATGAAPVIGEGIGAFAQRRRPTSNSGVPGLQPGQVI